MTTDQPLAGGTASPDRSAEAPVAAWAGSVDEETSGSSALMDDINRIAVPIGLLVLALVLVTFARRRLANGETPVLAPAGPVRAPAGPDLDSRPVERIGPPPAPLLSAEEENLPRWLRPSLRAERFGMVGGVPRDIPAALRVPPPTRTPLAFGALPDDPDARRIVRSDGVSLLDAPDELAGRSVAQLESGDEIEVLDEAGAWVNVFTPTGRAGWLAASSLGPRVAPGDQSGDATGQTVADPSDLAAILIARSRRASSAEPPAPPARASRSSSKPAAARRSASKAKAKGSRINRPR